MTKIEVQRSARQSVPAEPDEAALLVHLSSAPSYIDEIVRRSDLPSARVSSLLAVMELKGLVRQVSTLNYVRV